MLRKIVSTIVVLFFTLPLFAKSFSIDTLPIQDGGRLKPFHTYARETLILTYGRSKFKDDKDKKHPATQIVATWMMVPEVWQDKRFIRLDHLGLKKALNVESKNNRKFFSPAELFSNPRLDVLFRDLQGKVEVKEKLNPFYQAVQKLQNQLMTFHAVRVGALRVAPNKSAEDSTWVAVKDLDVSLRDQFFKVLKAYAQTFTQKDQKEVSQQALEQELASFVAGAREQNPQAYPQTTAMDVEVHYNKLSPFMWSWICYLLGVILIFITMLLGLSWSRNLAWVSVAVAFLLHTYGFALRVYLTGRPPVSNMYETVIWVAWGTIVFTAIFSRLKKKDYLLLAGSAVAALSMVVADMAPAILDATLQPLEPVLRSNLWLIIHVMTITLSYAAFFLALGISNVGLFYIIKGESAKSAKVKDLVDSTYKSLQIGVVLLAAGTILGGVWADYSWGRFWGWDPKETWALIALLGYLALLHGRLAGWIQGFGMMAGSIVAFNLVIMAWYGVNFVLGAGLHSYGFGAGGIEYVSIFCGLQLVYVFYAGLVKS